MVAEEVPSEYTWTVNSLGTVMEDSPLYKEASPHSRRYGVIPAGAVVTVLGELQEGFMLVEVPLRKRKLGGWLLVDVLEPVKKGKAKMRTRRQRVLIPDDEKILLKRESEFLYGAQAGSTFAYITSPATPYVYTGIGFYGGGYIGLFVAPTIPIRLEVNYLKLMGAGDDGLLLDFGFLEFGLVGSLLFKQWEISVGLQYCHGASVGEVPLGIELAAASDLSSLWAQVGAGYRIPIGQVTSVVIRARYAGAFTMMPFSYHTFGISAAFELRG